MHVHVKNKGFTLIELLVVIAIIGALASVILASLNSAREKGYIANAQTELKGLRNAFEVLYDDTFYYPNGASDYCRNVTAVPNNEVDLSDPNAGIVANGSSWPNWQGPYMVVAVDPWGTPYYLDEDYQCMTATKGCRGINDAGQDSSVIVSCGPNKATASNACAYDTDNIVIRLCDN